MSYIYNKKNIISNTSVDQNIAIDSLLLNPWDLTVDSTKKLWISATGSGSIEEYSITDDYLNTTFINSYSVPSSGSNILGSTGGHPTGIVINNNLYGYTVPNITSNSAILLIATLDGTVCGLNYVIDPITGTNSYLKISVLLNNGILDNAIYTGITQAGSYIYIADFYNNKIDVYDPVYNQLNLNGNYPFYDSSIPSGYATFNVKFIDGFIFVTYALQNKTYPNDTSVFLSGSGYINVFTIYGQLIGRFAEGTELNAPLGLTIIPKKNGPFVGKLLVGNIGNGNMNVYSYENLNKLNNITSQIGTFIESIESCHGCKMKISNLHGIISHNDVIYFVAGQNNISDTNNFKCKYVQYNGICGFVYPCGKFIC
jgi:uncharacterized protein (TIGR03118 family)